MNKKAVKLLKANAQIHRRRSQEASYRKLSEPEPIGKIVPAVLADIRQRGKND